MSHPVARKAHNLEGTDYICEVCSKRRKGRSGKEFIPIEGQQRHYVFVHVEDERIKEILMEEKFLERGMKDFVLDE